MKYFKDIPIGIWLFAVVIIIFNFHYWILYPAITGEHPSISIILSLNPIAFFFWSSLILSIVEIYAVTYGFFKAKNWARLYEIGLLLYSSFWAIMSMFVMRWQVIEHYIYFVMYVILIIYLLMSPVKEYFVKPNSNAVHPIAKSSIYKHGEYILHKRNIKLKSGGTRNLYFFSKKESEKGVPCDKPDGYIVDVNKIGLPYLRKKA